MNPDALTNRQDAILKELQTIRFMKKGSLSHQRWTASKGGARTVYGPYPILTWKEQGRTKSLRLTTEEEVAWAQAAIGNYRRFVALCGEYEALAEQRALGQRTARTTSQEAEKKGLKSRRKRKRK
jgi:hypothetical protein